LASAGRATTGPGLLGGLRGRRGGRLRLAGGIRKFRWRPRRGQYHRGGVQWRVSPGPSGHGNWCCHHGPAGGGRGGWSGRCSLGRSRPGRR